MEHTENTQFSPFNAACYQILREHPEAIGVAYRVLDCGCALLCGASAAGEPTGTLKQISGQPVKAGNTPPICLKCKKDDGLDRVVWDGIFWPGSQNEWPEKELRISIGRKVFGPGYMEPE